MSTTEMPETIVAWRWDGLKAGQWYIPTKPTTYDVTYTRTDLVEAERAECIKVLRDIGAAVKTGDDSDNSYFIDISAETVEKLFALLAKLEAKS